MSFNVNTNIFIKIMLYFVAFGLLIGSGSLYRYAYSYNLIMFIVILFMSGIIFYNFFIPTNKLSLKNSSINYSGLMLLMFFIFIPIVSDLVNQVKSYEITYFHMFMMLITFLLGTSSREKILSYYLNLMIIFSAISLIYFSIELFSEIPSFLPYYGIPQDKLSHFYYVWSRPVSEYFVVRNQSIFWEPGAFGFHLIIATLLAYQTGNKTFIAILILSCITTMSTTVFIFLFLLFLYQLFLGKKKIRFISIFIISSILTLFILNAIMGNLELISFLLKIVTDKFSVTSVAYESFQERTLFLVESVKLFMENILLGAGHYATAEELTEIGSETSALVGLAAELGILGIFSILSYMMFFRYFKIFSIPIVLIWLNGEYMPYTAISLFILTHVIDDISIKLFPVSYSNNNQLSKLKIKTNMVTN